MSSLYELFKRNKNYSLMALYDGYPEYTSVWSDILNEIELSQFATLEKPSGKKELLRTLIRKHISSPRRQAFLDIVNDM